MCSFIGFSSVLVFFVFELMQSEITYLTEIVEYSNENEKDNILIEMFLQKFV